MRRAMLGLLALLLVPAPVRAAPIVLDALTDPYPPSACLTTGQPVLFTGTYCDGTSCPPGPLAPWCPGAGFAQQDNLDGVLPHGQRTSSILHGGDFNRSVSARIDPALRQILVSVPESGGVDGLWWTYDRAQGPDWNLDLLDAGVWALRVPLSGTITPQRPLVVRVVMGAYSNNDQVPDGVAVIDHVATAPGDAILPFTSFDVQHGVVFDSVDYVSIMVTECGSSSCPGGTRPARQFAIGALTFDDAGPTSPRTSSWGRLKTVYR